MRLNPRIHVWIRSRYFAYITLLASACLLLVGLPLPVVSQQPAEKKPVDQTRYKQAVRLQKQAERFKLHARSYHLVGQTRTKEAQKLRKDAQQLRAKTTQYLLPGGQAQGDYKDRLAKYRALADQYRTHASRYAAHAQVRERIAMESRIELARYQQHCREYQAHARQFHNGLEHPDYCPPTKAAHEGLAPLSRQYQQDRLQIAREEDQLRQEEQNLRAAEQGRAAVEQELLSNAARRASEQGLQNLQSEYQALQKEQAHFVPPGGQ